VKLNHFQKVCRPFSRLSRTGLIVAVAAGVIVAGGGVALASHLGGSPGQVSSVDLEKGLAGFWKFDGNAKDATPFADDGTVNGATLTADRKGRANSAYSFNGTNAEIDMSDTPALSPTSAVTVSAWVNGTVQNTSYADGSTVGVASKDVGGGITNPPYSIQINNGSVQFLITGSSNSFNSATTTGLLDNTWYSLVGTFDGTNIKIYVNGVLRTTLPFTSDIGDSNGLLRIGRQKGTFSRFFTGTIDDARIYSRAISATEVTALYRSYDATFRAAAGEKGLVGQWKMDGNAKDATPNAEDGTVAAPTLTTDRKGAANTAYSFNGTSDYIYNSVGTSSPLQMGTKDWTISGWIKSNASGTFQGIAGTFNISSAASYWYLRKDSTNQLLLRLQNTNTNSVSYTSTGTITDTNWHHVAVSIVRSGLATFYIDGAPAGTANVSAFNGVNINFASEFNIGNIGSHLSSYFFNGSLDDIRVYSRALSAAEITTQYQSYNSALGLGGAGGTINLGKGLVGEWDMNGNAKDSTPFANNGTVTGAALTTDRKGRANSAYSFNGTSDFIHLQNGINYSFPNTTFSVSYWQRNTTAAGTFTVANGASGGGWGIRNDGQVLLKNAANQQSLYTPTGSNQLLLVNGAWHHVSCIITTSTTNNLAQSIQLYVDGVLDGGSFDHAFAYATNTDLSIGARTLGNNFGGSLDDVRIYNRALSAAEIAALYRSYK
jgi:hypothetical protein